ncbi:TMEM175 family protein [Phenylobacterium sp.]|uniref:TMEM175 family protein n=1 Tax=Phenylobacterium sp. TaxID=1871053 RepID=UPI0025EC7AC6|nr:TMEM175 family protein [Phenylobacterium sp.]
MYSRRRLDGLADSIYGVAMTLLVLEIRLPEGFEPHSSQDLLDALGALAPKFWPYVLSFAVLGGRWRSVVKDRTGHEPVGQQYVNWWLIHLLMVTFIPFSSMVMGRYASLPPAVWVYAANLAGLSVAGWGLAVSAPEAERAKVGENRGGVVMLLISAALAVAISSTRRTTRPWPSS